MIKCLPKEVQGKLRSGVAIPSLQQCVEELILNSIDAGATCVGVRMDMDAFKVQVIDNGSGISAGDMECVGSRHYTSKCSCVEDLDDLRWYGYRGEALASIVSLATLVEISSRSRSAGKTHVKLFKDGKSLDAFEADTARPSAGTTVLVCNFFHNMPVRRKRVDPVLEGERIRHRVEAVSLMHPSVSFTLKNDCTGAMLVQLPKARDTYHRFVQIHSLGRAQKLGEVSYSHGQFEVVGFIGREGHYNSSLQFLYVNDRLLLRTRIHKLLNVLLRRLSTSNQKHESPEGPSGISSPKHKRRQELHAVYVINIKCSYSEYDICLEPAKSLIEFKDWDGVLLCVEEAVKAFLSRENLIAVISQEDYDYASPKLFVSNNGEQEGDTGDHATSSTSTQDCTVGIKLASELVHRTHMGDSVYKSSVCQESDLTGFNKESDNLEEKRFTQLKTINSEGHVNKECGDKNITEEEEPSVTKAGDVCQSSCMSSWVGQTESEQPLKAAETHLNNTQQVPSELNTPEQIQPCAAAGGHGQTLGGYKKISLSDPYHHESLKCQQRSHIKIHQDGSSFQQKKASQNFEAGFLAPKRKISLGAGPEAKVCLVSSVPSNIPRIPSCQKLSLGNEPGSLDKFRRVFVKPAEMKSSSLGAGLWNSAEPPQMHPDDVNINKACSVPPRPPGRSAFTGLRQNSAQVRCKGSLAAKLCSLKQDRTESDVVPHLSSSASEDDTCLNDGNNSLQDRNNNEAPPDAALGPEPVSGWSTTLDDEEEDPASGDWLHHYDTSVGKTVYVNRLTGLSKYDEPSTEETQLRCISDVTNMAVSVVNNMDRRLQSTNSLSTLYSTWNNPVFVRPPTVAVDVSSGRADGLAVKIHNVLFPYRFSKAMIHTMKVIHQVDKKFLACLINTRDDEPAANAEGNLLVLVDQHAAHERVRLEGLVADSYEDDPEAPGERRLCSSTISPPLVISVTEEELRLLQSRQAHLRSLGLDVKFSHAADPQVLVGKVPLCFMEKERNEVRRGRASVIRPLVEVYLQEQIELLHSAGRVGGTLPLAVLNVLASLACHGAIKFNHSLSRDECFSLVASLSSCQLPFQCAHGRPSIAPLVDILHLDKDQKESQRPNLQRLRRMYRAWELCGNG
ncbi:DNA mismatch repair protein Mlh3 isoform X2 [Betta splendens]|uniref:DNA mismatch repair protein Mlh3 isoform X2 n=1 Tax=Betta splendens TaxID=158456 RepID=A0A6P7LME0_BETSP|nr:DNA mismatch repair protein Mlh3 isoform X2 [Betta splendens]